MDDAGRTQHVLGARVIRLLDGGPYAPIRLLLAFGLPILALAMAIPGVVKDPFITAAAYGTLLGDTAPAYALTLSDGRWLGWLWARVAADLSLPHQQALFYGAWAVTSGSLGLALFRRDRLPFRPVIAALALCFSAPAAGLALALPQELPGMALVAVYAAVLWLTPAGFALWATLPIAALGLMAAHWVPLTLLAMLLAAGRVSGRPGELRRSVLAVFGGLALGALAIFLINLKVHGVFGLVRPGGDGADTDLMALVLPWLAQVAASFFGPEPLLGVGLIALGLVTLFLRRALVADRLLGGIGLVLIVTLLGVMRSGEGPLFAEALPLWILVVAVLAWASAEAPLKVASLVFVAALAGAALTGAVGWRAELGAARDYQAASRALAAEIAAEAASRGPLVVAGSPGALDGASVLTDHQALAKRLEHLTKRPTVQCPNPDPLCARYRTGLVSMPVRPSPGWITTDAQGVTLIRLPDGVFVAAPKRR